MWKRVSRAQREAVLPQVEDGAHRPEVHVGDALPHPWSEEWEASDGSLVRRPRRSSESSSPHRWPDLSWEPVTRFVTLLLSVVPGPLHLMGSLTQTVVRSTQLKPYVVRTPPSNPYSLSIS